MAENRIINKLIISTFLYFLLFLLTPKSAYAQFFCVTGSTPPNGATNVPLDTPIIIHFNQSLNNYSVPRQILYEGTTGNPLPISLLFQDGDCTLVIVPRVSLKPGTYYLINLKGIQATSSWLLDPWSDRITFTTKSGHLSVVSYVSPRQLTLAAGGSQEVSYSFIESGGGIAEIVQAILIYEDESGKSISKSTENIRIIIRNNDTTKFQANISIPRDIGNYAMGQTITVRRIFEGLDHEGNKVQFRTGVKVNILNSSAPLLKITDIEIKVPEFGMIIPKESIMPAEAHIKGKGTGDIHGTWKFDGEPKSFFVTKMTDGEMVKVYAQEKDFALKEGKHRLFIEIMAPEKLRSEEIIYIVSISPTVTPILLKPEEGATFSSLTGTPPVFRWSQNPSATSYKIAIGKSKNFQDSDWIVTGSNFFSPDITKWSSFGSGTFYWVVKPLFSNNQEGPTSEVCSFTIKSSP